MTITPAPPPAASTPVRGKIQGRTFEPTEIDAIISDLTHYRYSDMEIAAFLIGSASFMTSRELLALAHAMAKAGTRLKCAKPHRRRQALHRRHPGKPHVHGRGPDRGGAWPDHPQDILARDHLAGRHRRHHGGPGPGRRLGVDEMKEGGCGLSRLSRLGRTRQPVAGGRHPHLGGAPACARHPRADGCLDHVEEARGGLDPLADRPAGRPDAKLANASEAMRLRKLFEFVGDHFGIAVEVITTDGRQPIGNGIGPVLEASDVMAVLTNEPDGPADLREKSLRLAAHLLEYDSGMRGGTGYARARELLDSGAA